MSDSEDLTWTAVEGEPISTIIIGYSPDTQRLSWRQRLSTYFDFRDWWVGLYIDTTYLYVCIFPTLVIRWARSPWVERIYELGNYQSVGPVIDRHLDDDGILWSAHAPNAAMDCCPAHADQQAHVARLKREDYQPYESELHLLQDPDDFDYTTEDARLRFNIADGQVWTSNSDDPFATDADET